MPLDDDVGGIAGTVGVEPVGFLRGPSVPERLIGSAVACEGSAAPERARGLHPQNGVEQAARLEGGGPHTLDEHDVSGRRVPQPAVAPVLPVPRPPGRRFS